jgi:hypothetical protein
MKQVNFSHPGGFPLEQETLERLQTAYRSELYEALKGHLSIETGTNYIITPATTDKKGWAVIHQDGEGILYPIEKAKYTGFLKTTRTTTPLVFGDGVAHDAYLDYKAEYISFEQYDIAPKDLKNINKALPVQYYDLAIEKFKIVKDIKGIEKLISDTNLAISALSNSVTTSLALKADKTEVASLSNTVTTSLALKADKTEVTSLSNAITTSLTLKADKTEVVNLANSVNNSLALKADKTEVTSLSNAVTTSLALKAEKTAVDELLEKVVTIEEKLGTIARGAEVNVQADFGVTDQNNDAYIKGKPITALSDILAKGSFDIGDCTSTDNERTVYFTQIDTYDYMIFGSLRSKSASENWNDNNDVIWTVKPINTFAFELYLREVSPNIQNIAFDYIIVKK